MKHVSVSAETFEKFQEGIHAGRPSTRGYRKNGRVIPGMSTTLDHLINTELDRIAEREKLS